MSTHKEHKEGSAQGQPRHALTGQGNLEFVQALRGVAALMVVLLHILQQQAIPPNDKGIFNWLFGAGGAGVPLFFIISGFIMVYSTNRVTPNVSSAFSFIVKRALRIWPTYAILTVLFWVAVTLADRFVGAKFPYTISDVAQSIAFVPFKTNSAPAPLFAAPVLYPGWSLNYEMYFYALIALSLLAGRYRWHMLFTVLAATLIGLPLAHGHTPSIDIAEKYGYSSYLVLMASPIIWEFAAGVAIGLLYLSPVRFNSRNIAIYLSCFSASVVIWVLLSKKAFWGMGMDGWGWSLTLMFLCLAIASKTVTLPAPKSLVWLGDISYSLYLVHPLFLKPVFDIGWETSYREAFRDPSFALVILAAAIGAAAVSRHFLEQRLSNFLRDLVLRRTGKSSGTAATASTV